MKKTSIDSHEEVLNTIKKGMQLADYISNEIIEPFKKQMTPIFTALQRYFELQKEKTEYAQRILDEIGPNNEFEIIKHVLPADILGQLMFMDEKEWKSFIDFTRSSYFHQFILEEFDRLSLDTIRRIILEQAIEQHKNSNYASAVCLHIILIEGILTDCLIKNGYAKLDKSVVKTIDNNELNGLHAKVKYLSNKLADQFSSEKYQNVLLQQFKECFCNAKINKIRNKIVHGDSIDFNTERNSALFMLWVYVVINISGYIKNK